MVCYMKDSKESRMTPKLVTEQMRFRRVLEQVTTLIMETRLQSISKGPAESGDHDIIAVLMFVEGTCLQHQLVEGSLGRLIFIRKEDIPE